MAFSFDIFKFLCHGNMNRSQQFDVRSRISRIILDPRASFLGIWGKWAMGALISDLSHDQSHTPTK